MVTEKITSARSFNPISPPGVIFSIGWQPSVPTKPLPIGRLEKMAWSSILGCEN